MFASNRLLAGAARPVELIVAAVFLVGAILKAADIDLFIIQISHYGVLSDRSVIKMAALATIALETGLAASLLLKIRLHGLTYAGILVLLAAFTGLIIYGWAFYGLEDCGCFGPIEISPAASIGKNGIIAALAVMAWAGLAWSGKLKSTWRRVAVAMPAAVLAALAVSAYSYAHIRIQTDTPPDARPFAEFVFQSDGGTIDLGKGEYLVAIYDADCPHCKGTVSAVNDLSQYPGVPPVVAICHEGEPGKLDEFRTWTEPEFPLCSIGDDFVKFFSLINEFPPRFSLVRDGVPIKHWDEKPPAPEELIEALNANSSGNTG